MRHLAEGVVDAIDPAKRIVVVDARLAVGIKRSNELVVAVVGRAARARVGIDQGGTTSVGVGAELRQVVFVVPRRAQSIELAVRVAARSHGVQDVVPIDAPHDEAAVVGDDGVLALGQTICPVSSLPFPFRLSSIVNRQLLTFFFGCLGHL